MDFKLGEWFKQVEKSEQELKAKRKDGDDQPIVMAAEPVIDRIEIREPAAQAQSSVVATMTSSEVVADVATMQRPSESSIFDEGEVPQVEDFFSFMGETGSPKPIVREEEPPLDIPMGRRSTGTLGSLDILSEGTGNPRPIIPNMPKLDPVPEVISKAYVEAKPAPAPKKETVKKQAAVVAEPSALEENWARMPAHLQILFGNPASEVAQNSYKAFKDSRGEMIQRLLDPQLTLEEAARILNVCPTTVRRYTNRGSLKHLRTAGNQRRFRLSDVLAFMESK